MEPKHKVLIICLANGFGSFITAIPCLIPFLCWLFWKDDADGAVADYARRRLNASISWTLWSIISLALTVVLIGYVALLVLMIWGLIAIILDLIRASSGDTGYKFPLTVQFIKPKQL